MAPPLVRGVSGGVVGAWPKQPAQPEASVWLVLAVQQSQRLVRAGRWGCSRPRRALGGEGVPRNYSNQHSGKLQCRLVWQFPQFWFPRLETAQLRWRRPERRGAYATFYVLYRQHSGTALFCTPPPFSFG